MPRHSKHPAQGVGRLIVYGIEGKQNDVDSVVYDALYIVEKGKMVMQTDLDINGHQLFTSKKYYIQGYLDTSKDNKFSLNGFQKFPLPEDSVISEIAFHFHPTLAPYPSVRFKIYLDYFGNVSKYFEVVSPTTYNKIPTNLSTKNVTAPCVTVILLGPIPKNREMLMLITYIVP